MKAQDFLESGSNGDAISFLDEAIDALTLETVRVDLATGEETPVSPLESCISEEMGSMDRALRATPDSRTMLAHYADEVKRALLAVWQARECLKKGG